MKILQVKNHIGFYKSLTVYNFKCFIKLNWPYIHILTRDLILNDIRELLILDITIEVLYKKAEGFFIKYLHQATHNNP